jgi:hypothetical protein
MASIVAPGPISPGWILNKEFDTGFILGTALVALLSGAVVVVEPALFPIVLTLDIWLLGYHHVISTFTRLSFDRASFQEHRFLVLGLPVIVLAGSLLAVWGIGFWALTTTYLYWQWFHYTRQSWGVSQVYRRKAGGTEMESEGQLKAVFYLLPLTGILYRSNQAPTQFLGQEVRVLPVPDFVVWVLGCATAVSLVAFTWSRLGMWRRGTLPTEHTAYMASHFGMFSMGYLLVDSLDFGWLILNIWHNAQYIVFVWIFNNRRYKEGVDAQAPLLSSLSQTSRWPHYFVVCFLLSSAFYAVLGSAEGLLDATVVPAVVIYQTINFHHYVVDGLIWKTRKAPMRKTLGLA